MHYRAILDQNDRFLDLALMELKEAMESSVCFITHTLPLTVDWQINVNAVSLLCNIICFVFQILWPIRNVTYMVLIMITLTLFMSVNI